MSGGTAGGGFFNGGARPSAIYADRVTYGEAARMIRQATEADLKERGIPIPPTPISRAAIFWLGFLSAVALIMLLRWCSGN
jgi:hypothetical protein